MLVIDDEYDDLAMICTQPKERPYDFDVSRPEKNVRVITKERPYDFNVSRPEKM